jgi:sulfite exporter TauE/SafE/copper chaperone CopZ/plastocyanin domain-containing protein
MTTRTLRIGGMTCAHCQSRIEKALQGTAGVSGAAASYNDGTATVTFDERAVTLAALVAAVEALDYAVRSVGAAGERAARRGEQPRDMRRAAGFLLAILALAFAFRQLAARGAFPLAEAGMGYGALFIVGLITSLHCAAMCGGISLSQCLAPGAGSRFASLRPALRYNAGRVASYTAVGAAVGALGSAVSLSGAFRGAVQLVAGAFMALMGINMLGLFPKLRRFAPRMPRALARRVDAGQASSKSPFRVGLLNGLMPCGPLQAMQLYALGTGSAARGALSMLLFSLGTVPLMFGLGALSSALTAGGRALTRTAMTAGAVLVAALGLTMFAQGWSLSGFASLADAAAGLFAGSRSAAPAGDAAYSIEDNVQLVSSALLPGKYPAITVRAGLPVRWTIDAPEGSINGCNNRMIIGEYGVEHRFAPGRNVVEFTPKKPGKVRYSCWMGMIRGTITVLDAGADVALAPAPADAPPEPVPAGYAIPTETVALASVEGGTQTVRIRLTDDGIEPAVVVVQEGIVAEWLVDNDSADEGNAALRFPAYRQSVPLQRSENRISFLPTASFGFSTGDSIFYGYVKVTDDIRNLDLASVRAEAAAHETLIYPDEYFRPADGESSVPQAFSVRK